MKWGDKVGELVMVREKRIIRGEYSRRGGSLLFCVLALAQAKELASLVGSCYSSLYLHSLRVF